MRPAIPQVDSRRKETLKDLDKSARVAGGSAHCTDATPPDPPTKAPKLPSSLLISDLLNVPPTSPSPQHCHSLDNPAA